MILFFRIVFDVLVEDMLGRGPFSGGVSSDGLRGPDNEPDIDGRAE